MPIAAAIPAIIGGGTALIAGSMQSSAAKKTASAVQSASDQSAATQRYIFDQTRADNAVRQGAGDAATRQMMALMGLGGGGGFAPQQSGQAASYNGGKDGSGPMYAQGQGGAQTLPQSTNALSGAQSNMVGQGDIGVNDYAVSGVRTGAPGLLGGYGSTGMSGGYQQPSQGQAQGGSQPGQATGNALQSDPTAWLRSTPGYDFNFNEGMRALNTGLAGQGRLQSGDAQREAIQFGQNYGDRIYGDQYNRLAGMAGMGQTASSQSQAAGSNYANAMTNINQNNANGLASSYQNNANAWTNALGGVAGAGLWAYGKGQ